MTFKEVTLYVSDTQLKELGNAIAAYADILWSIQLGLPVNQKFEVLRHLSDDDIRIRLDSLKQLHYDLKNKWARSQKIKVLISRSNFKSQFQLKYAGVVHRLVRQPSKLDRRVRFPLPAPSAGMAQLAAQLICNQ